MWKSTTQQQVLVVIGTLSCNSQKSFAGSWQFLVKDLSGRASLGSTTVTLYVDFGILEMNVSKDKTGLKGSYFK